MSQLRSGVLLHTGQVISNTRHAMKSYLARFSPFLEPPRASRVATFDRWGISGSHIDERKSEQRLLRIKITQNVAKYFLSGSGGFSTGRSPAPEFSGSGYPAKEPPFKFSFEDSFGNKGVTFVTPTKTGIIFSATINEEEDPRCLIFYKTSELKRIATE